MYIMHFLAAHWSDLTLALLGLFIASAKVIPPQFAGLDKDYIDFATNQKMDNKRQSLIDMLGHALIWGVLRSFLTIITMRGATSLVLFAVIGYVLVAKSSLDGNAVTLSAIAIVALYAEQLVANAKTIEIWKIFKYDSKDSINEPR